jgi:hypothetical protein
MANLRLVGAAFQGREEVASAPKERHPSRENIEEWVIKSLDAGNRLSVLVI